MPPQRRANWAFAHPGSGANCTRCHTPPGQAQQRHVQHVPQERRQELDVHASRRAPTAPSATRARRTTTAGRAAPATRTRARAGSSRIRAGRATAPAATPRPGATTGSTCQNCHKNAGKSWSFSHPGTSSSCTSCHSAPSNHYGTTCASVPRRRARPGRTSTSAIRRSRAASTPTRASPCTKCHPSRTAGVLLLVSRQHDRAVGRLTQARDAHGGDRTSACESGTMAASNARVGDGQRHCEARDASRDSGSSRAVLFSGRSRSPLLIGTSRRASQIPTVVTSQLNGPLAQSLPATPRPCVARVDEDGRRRSPYPQDQSDAESSRTPASEGTSRARGRDTQVA